MNWNIHHEGCFRVYTFLGAVFDLRVGLPLGSQDEWLRRQSQTQTFTSPGLTMNNPPPFAGRTGAPRNLPRPIRSAEVRKKK